jgi:hypothetical protein
LALAAGVVLDAYAETCTVIERSEASTFRR